MIHSRQIATNSVACGDVAKLSSNLQDGEIVVSGLVHAEMKSSTWYLATARFSPSQPPSNPHDLLTLPDPACYVPHFRCVCKARANEKLGMNCKHTAALMYGLLAWQQFSDCESPPKLFQRSGMDKFRDAPPFYQEMVGFQLTWRDIVQQLVRDPPAKRSWSSTRDKKLTKPEQLSNKKRKKKKQAEKAPTPLKGGEGGLWTVKQLKGKLKEVGLKQSGLKQELIERLKVYEASKVNSLLSKMSPTPPPPITISQTLFVHSSACLLMQIQQKEGTPSHNSPSEK